MGSFIALLSVIANSTYAAFGKILLDYLPPLTLTALAQFISVLALLLIFGLLPECHKFLKLPTKEKVIILLMAILGGVLAPLLFYYGLRETSAINAVLLTRTEPLIMGLLSVFWLGEKGSHDQWIGSLFIGCGTIWVMTQGFSRGFIFSPYDLLIVLSAATWALSNVLFKKYTHHLPVELVVISRNIIGCTLLILVLPFVFHNIEVAPIQDFDPRFWQYFLLFCLITILLTQSLWYKALEMIPSPQATTIDLALPFFGLLWVTLLLEETFSMYHLVGGSLIIMGLSFIIFKQSRHPHHSRHQKAKHWY